MRRPPHQTAHPVPTRLPAQPRSPAQAAHPVQATLPATTAGTATGKARLDKAARDGNTVRPKLIRQVFVWQPKKCSREGCWQTKPLASGPPQSPKREAPVGAGHPAAAATAPCPNSFPHTLIHGRIRCGSPLRAPAAPSPRGSQSSRGRRHATLSTAPQAKATLALLLLSLLWRSAKVGL